ncbi:MAG: HAD family phosphatase [Verrucomicrobiota bacterium]
MGEGKAILWDNDGVLVDTERWFFEANRRELAALGVEVSWADFEEINLKRGESLLPLSGLEGDELKELYGRRDALYAALLRTEEIAISGMEDLLGELKGEGFVMGIVTSSHRESFEIIHGRSGLLASMDFWVVRENYDRGKPHPDGYLMGIERAGVAVGDCLAVEDSPRGVAAARGAGLEVVYYSPGGVGAEREVGAVWWRAGSPEELGETIRGWGRDRGV